MVSQKSRRNDDKLYLLFSRKERNNGKTEKNIDIALPSRQAANDEKKKSF